MSTRTENNTVDAASLVVLSFVIARPAPRVAAVEPAPS